MAWLLFCGGVLGTVGGVVWKWAGLEVMGIVVAITGAVLWARWTDQHPNFDSESPGD